MKNKQKVAKPTKEDLELTDYYLYMEPSSLGGDAVVVVHKDDVVKKFRNIAKNEANKKGLVVKTLSDNEVLNEFVVTYYAIRLNNVEFGFWEKFTAAMANKAFQEHNIFSHATPNNVDEV